MTIFRSTPESVLRLAGAAAILLLSLGYSVFAADFRSAAGEKSASETSRPFMNTRSVRHLSPNDRILNAVSHPAFAEFGNLILPGDALGANDPRLISDFATLLPYHSHVNPHVVVQSLNRLIDDATAGKTIFYPFYSESERLADTTKAQTGLFFFRGKPGAPFAVIAPGGGFSYVGSVHEGFPYAVELNRRGFNAFVIRYRVRQGGTVATTDLAAALKFIFENAAALEVSTQGYSLWGSSAGARMAAAIGTHGADRFGGGRLPKPSTVVTAYTAHSEVGAEEPPTFVVVGEHDGIAPPRTMETRVSALRSQGVRVEFRIYPGVGHGFGLGTGTSADGWLADAIKFWNEVAR